MLFSSRVRVRIRINVLSGGLVVSHTYSYYFLLALSHSRGIPRGALWSVESCMGMGEREIHGDRGKTAVMGTRLTVIPWGWGQASRLYCGNGDSKSKKLTYRNGITVTHRMW